MHETFAYEMPPNQTTQCSSRAPSGRCSRSYFCFLVTGIGQCQECVDRNLQVELLKLATAVEMLEKCGAYA